MAGVALTGNRVEDLDIRGPSGGLCAAALNELGLIDLHALPVEAELGRHGLHGGRDERGVVHVRAVELGLQGAGKGGT